MKKYLLLITISFLGLVSLAQNVGINATGALPHPSAILDVSSPNKGILVPRTSTASRVAILGPAKGLMVYDTTTSSFWFHDGSAWSEIPKGPVDGSGGYWAAKDANIYYKNGHVGIGTDTAQEPLTVQTADLQRGFSHRGQNGKVLTSFMGDTFAEFATVDKSDLYLGAGGLPHITISGKTGNVGINVVNAKNVLQVGEVGNTFSGFPFAYGDGTDGSVFQQAGGTSYWRSSSNMSLAPKFGSGNVGINSGNVANTLQIGDMGSTGIAGNAFAFGNGTNGAAFNQGNTAMQLQSSTDITLISKGGAGNIGINSPLPVTNRLQIGNAGGFAGNDIAFGNGAQVTALAQTANYLLVGTNTDIVLSPKYGTNLGRVGINTGTPRATLDVNSSTSVFPLSQFYTYMSASSGTISGDDARIFFQSSPGPVPFISIIASNNIYANEFDAYSDVRIKNLIGTSDAKQDLQTINKIAIRDYTMKDKLKYGNQHFKKVIAQELEKVYPDLVARHTDFIPNVYQFTDTVRKVEGGYLLHFLHEHHLGDTAKKVQAVLTEPGGLQTYDIVAIPSPMEVVIDAPGIKMRHVFVYGEEIPDFRTVDYEGLTTLNVSVTQELSREVKDLQRALANANASIRTLTQMINKLTTPSVVNRLSSERTSARKVIKKQTKKI